MPDRMTQSGGPARMNSFRRGSQNEPVQAGLPVSPRKNCSGFNNRRGRIFGPSVNSHPQLPDFGSQMQKTSARKTTKIHTHTEIPAIQLKNPAIRIITR